MDSILTSIKKMLGITEEYTQFDMDLIININSVFTILHQMGVGPGTPYHITDKTNTWDEFLGDEGKIELVKTYIYLKCKLMFDPPTVGAVMESYNRQISEYEWRLNVACDPDDTFE